MPQKLQSQKATLMRTLVLKEAQKNLWKKVLTKERISSDESGREIDGGEAWPLIYIEVLPWSTPKLGLFFRALAQKNSKTNKSCQSKQQTLIWTSPFKFLQTSQCYFSILWLLNPFCITPVIRILVLSPSRYACHTYFPFCAPVVH